MTKNVANARDGTTSVVFDESKAALPPIPEGLILFLFGEEETQDGNLPIPPNFLDDDQTSAIWYVDSLIVDLRNYEDRSKIRPSWIEWCSEARGRLLALYANTSSGPGPAGRSGHITD